MKIIEDLMKDRLIANSNKGITEFFSMLKVIIEAAWGDNWGVFTDSEPTGTDPADVQLPIISYSTIKRIPCKSIPNLKPRAMHIIKDPDNSTDNLIVYRQWFDYTVRFGIWTATNNECVTLMDQLEELILGFVGYFKEQGVSEILFVLEEEGKVLEQERQKISHRSLVYDIRIERITLLRSSKMQQILETVYLQQDKERQLLLNLSMTKEE